MNQDLAVIDKIGQLKVALQSYRPEDYNLLLPTTDLRFIAEDHRIIINTVRLEPEEDFWPVDVTWSKQNGQWQKNVTSYALSKRGLRRLMHISGASVTESQTWYDDAGRAHARTTVRMTMADGLTRQFIGSYTWDTPARIEEAEARYQEKIAKEPAKKEQHRKAFEADRYRIIKFATSLAETGATNRALRDALTTKGKYTPDEIEKPFVCLQVVEPRRPEIDLNHPIIRQLMSMAMLNTGHLPEELYQPIQPKAITTFVDPMSDAVAAGEVEAPTHQSKPHDKIPTFIEDLEVFDNTEAGPAPPQQPAAQSNGGNGHKWPARPWEAETLRAYMQQRAGEDTGEPDDESFRRMHAAMHTLTLGDEDKRKRVQEYLFDVQSSTELTAGQVQALYRWVGTTKDGESGEWLPSAHAVNELAAVVRAHQIESGQEDLFEDLFGEQEPAQELEPA